MALTRISAQSRQTLEDFYLEVSNEKSSSIWAERGNAMLAFIKIINELFSGPTIRALTSLERLILLNEDNYESRHFVMISCLNSKEFYFDYLMPLEKQPWPDATSEAWLTP